MADSLNAIPRGEYIPIRYSELVRLEQRDERSAEEIADAVISAAGLEVV